jgi:hypothetical protein
MLSSPAMANPDAPPHTAAASTEIEEVRWKLRDLREEMRLQFGWVRMQLASLQESQAARTLDAQARTVADLSAELLEAKNQLLARLDALEHRLSQRQGRAKR